MSNLISSNGSSAFVKVSRSGEISLQYLSARHHRDADYTALSLSRARADINFTEASKKVHVYQNVNYARPPPKIVFPTSRRELPFDSRRTDARVGDDRSRSRWHRAQWLFLPLLEKPFVSAYSFTALWFYHLNSASSDLFHHSPLAFYLPRSRILSICLRLPFSLSHPFPPCRCRTRHYVTIVPWNWTSFMYRMSMTLSRRAPHRTP